MQNLKAEFDHHLSGLAWSLWRELGVAGTNHFHETCLIQIEELIILTMIVSEHDPRLREEVLDWASRYHELISVTRLRAFLKEADSYTLKLFSQFVTTLNSISSAKWPYAAESSHLKAKISGKSLLPPLESSSLLALRLRNLFGPGVKADVLTYFLTRSKKHCSAADLVEIGYSKRSLMTALDQLTASKIIAVTHVRNKKDYELKKIKELQVVIGKLPKIAPPWNKILQVITTIRSVIPELQNSSETMKSIILRNCLIKIESLLPTFISPLLYNEPNFIRDWKAIIEIISAWGQGNFFMQFEVYDDFEEVVNHLLQVLYQVDDCIDGIEMIKSEIALKLKRHIEIYKESYQLFLSFISDLEVRLKQFLEFPFHKMMDESLADIPYQFSKEKLPQFLERIGKISPIDQITHAQLAIRQYQAFMPELNILRQTIYTFRKRLEELYFVKTNAHLLSLPNILHKRHLILDLFAADQK